MSTSSESWIDGLQFSSLFWPPPKDDQLRQAKVTGFVELFSHFTLEQFPEDIAQLIQNNYPSKEKRLLDEVLATFVLHHPEHGHAIVHPILSCIINGTLLYDKNGPPFSSFISLFSPNAEEYSERWALACGETLRMLTHYNRPIYKVDNTASEVDREQLCHASTNDSSDEEPKRPLSPWIADILLAAPLGIRSDYFRWCGGVIGKYATGRPLKPPITACSHGCGVPPSLVPLAPTWAVANGAGVVLSVCYEEVARYETATLTAAAVPALLLPPPTNPLDEHLVTGLPPLEPYARLFHLYYAIATPKATQGLLLGILEAPASWAPDALDAAMQLVEVLKVAESHATGLRLPRNWMHLHFLRAIGTVLSTRAGVAADAAAALLFRLLSEPAQLFRDVLHEPPGCSSSSRRGQMEAVADKDAIEVTAQEIASMLCAHGPEVERRICNIWEAAYGLLPLSLAAGLPEMVVASPPPPPTLSWNLFLPLIKVLEHLPRGSPSEACLMKIFAATVEAILGRTYPTEPPRADHTKKSRPRGGLSSTAKNLAAAELRTMIHSLFLESCACGDLASRLLFIMLAVCVSHETPLHGRRKRPAGDLAVTDGTRTEPGPVAMFDSFVLAAVYALAWELQLSPFVSKGTRHSDPVDFPRISESAPVGGASGGPENGVGSAVHQTRRLLGNLEALFLLSPSSVGAASSHNSRETIAGHVSKLLGRSRTCATALSVLMQCRCDDEICARASSLSHLIRLHGKVQSVHG